MMFQQESIDTLSLLNALNETQTLLQKMQKDFLEMKRNYEHSECENKILRERINQLKQQLFGTKSEKSAIMDDSSIQQLLFGPQTGHDGDNQEEDVEKIEIKEITVPEHKRKRRSRKMLLVPLVEKHITHDIPEAEKRCECGCMKVCIGEETSTEIEYVPAQVIKVCHHRKKYACKGCEGVEKKEGEATVQIAELPLKLLPKSISTPSLLSHILNKQIL